MTHTDQDPGARGQGSGAAGTPSPDVTLVVVALAALRPTYPASELLGRPVINDTGEEIGRLEDLMIERDRIAFAILSVGGFLGLGAHQIVVAFPALRIDDDVIVLPGATKEALREMTVYDREQVRNDRLPLRKAHKGMRDAGQVVTTMGDEPIPGIVADVADDDLH
jgi:sporulation protein YlmC with PRC-barrel domain